MLKKTIEFVDVDGASKTETHYFNLSEADLIKLQVREGEGFEDYLNTIIEAGNGQAIIDTFEKILRLAYGVRTQDGKFVKPPGAFDEFMAGEAYSKLFVELVTDGPKSAEFINGVMPRELAAKVQETQSRIGISENLQAHLEVVPEPTPYDPPADIKKKPRNMSKAELMAAYKEKNAARVAPHPYKDLPLDKALDLSPGEFEIWVNVNQ